ncbi:MAG: hypothetical protein IT307_16035, partial [Chloroflexi bacterium]|nr:hypothetical protein [Chloroflexota bacterium]
AFLITFEEWSKHHVPRHVVVTRSFESAGVAWVFFLLATLLLGGLFSLVVFAH